MSGEVSTIRLYVMRFAYLLNAVIIGYGAASGLASQRTLIYAGKPWDLIYGVAFSLYTAYALLLLLGVRFPVTMLPLLLLQLSYKLIWLGAVGYPLWSGGRMNAAGAWAVRFFATVVVIDIAVIPWAYVFEHYAKPLFRLERKRGSYSQEQPRIAT